MKNKKIYSIIVCIFCILSLVTLISFANESIVLRLGHIAGTDQPVHKGIEVFKNYVEEKTNNEITVEIYPASQLGHTRELLELIQMGGLEMTIVGISGLSSFDPSYSWYEVPFVFDNLKQVHNYWDSPSGKMAIERFLEKTGLRPLSATWDRLPRSMFVKKEIKKVEDLKDVKIRVPNAMFRSSMQALGATPVSLAFAEIYTGIQTGVVDGGEAPLDYIYSYALYEVAKNLILTNHTYGTQAFIIGENVWNKLEEEQKTIIIDGMRKGKMLNNEIISGSYEEYINKLVDGGMHLIEPEIDGFKTKMSQAYESFFDEWGEEVFRDIQNTEY